MIWVLYKAVDVLDICTKKIFLVLRSSSSCFSSFFGMDKAHLEFT